MQSLGCNFCFVTSVLTISTFDEMQSLGAQRNPIQMKDGISRRMLWNSCRISLHLYWFLAWCYHPCHLALQTSRRWLLNYLLTLLGIVLQVGGIALDWKYECLRNTFRVRFHNMMRVMESGCSIDTLSRSGIARNKLPGASVSSSFFLGSFV